MRNQLTLKINSKMGFAKMGFVLGFIIFLQHGFLFGIVKANVYPSYDWVLKEANYTRLCSTKSILTVNGRFPGPPIYVHKGDTVFINVRNQGLYGVTIHWHGVKQPRNPWSDGPENITQCPIQPGGNFTYEIDFSNEEGTLWWHAHSDWTRATVHGSILVFPAKGTSYPFSKPFAEQTLIIGSWFKGDVKAIIDQALLNGGEPNLSDAFTINGQPGDLYNCSREGTFRVLVNYGKTYLLRIINAVMNEEHFFGIAKHNLTVVGTDGAYIKPINTNYIMITPGQTMDVLVKANQPLSHYYIVSTPYADSNAPFDNTTTTAILQYKGNYTPPSSPVFPTLPAFNDTPAAERFIRSLRALGSKEHPINVPMNITTRMYITVSVNERICPNASCSGPNGNKLAASLNNISFVTPNVDVLQAYYRMLGGVYNTSFPNQPPYFFNFTADVIDNRTLIPSLGTNVKVLKYGEQVEITFQGTSLEASENHPMHLHGFSFYVVGIGKGNFNKTTSPLTYNLVDPPEVNTIGVPKLGWATIRFVADNPGVWFMHCHLERHASWGMNTVFIVKNGRRKASKIRPPPPYMPPCSKS